MDFLHYKKCVQMFNYHTAYSYLLKKKTCSKFSHIFNLGPKKHQFDYINELKQTKPKYILAGKNNQQYNASNIENSKSNFLYYSFVNPYVRFPYINSFISRNKESKRFFLKYRKFLYENVDSTDHHKFIIL